MADRQNPSRRSTADGSRQQTASRRSGSEGSRAAAPKRAAGDKKAPPRRNDVIRCEKCGEDYSVTYKRCPFCDERPGRGFSGKRVAGNTRGGGYGGPVNPVQIVGLVISLVLIIAALFIVFTRIAPLFTGSSSGGGSSVSAGQSTPGGSTSQGAGSGSGTDGSQGDGSTAEPEVNVQSVTLSQSDFTLQPGEDQPITVAVVPVEAADSVVWTSSDPTVATVDQDGLVTNVNTGSDTTKVTITAACGDKSAECTVYCVGSGTGSSGGGTSTGGGSLQPNSEATITGASGGLNIRSGPGTSYEVQASTQNGAVVTVLEEAGDGWYHIRYATGGGNYEEGYVLGDYLTAR